MQPDDPTASARRARRVALLLLGATLLVGAGGAIWFTRYASHVGRDPALVYRDPATLEKLLQRANDAERVGDRATALTTYRFVVAVAQGGEVALEPYVVAARAGLTRLGVGDTVPR
jgi:hypothetical protein